MEPTKLDLVAETAATLDDVLALTTHTLDDLYELATGLGQAVRLSRGHAPGSERLAGRIARARAVLAGEPASHVLAAFDVDAFLTDLEDQLDDEDLPREGLFSTLLDMDGLAAAALALGAPEAARGAVDDTTGLLAGAPDAVIPLQAIAARYVQRMAIGADDPAHPLWQAVAAASFAVAARPLAAGTAALIARQAEARVLQFPLQRAELGPQDWRMAAAEGDAGLPETRALATSEDGRWELVLEQPKGAWELVCYADEDAGILFEVRMDGGLQQVQSDGRGRRAVVLSTTADLDVRVGSEHLEIRWRE